MCISAQDAYASEEEATLLVASCFLYNEDFVKRLRSKTTSPAGGSKKL